MHVIHTLRHYTHSHTHAHGSYELDARRTMVAVCCPQRRVAIARRRAPPPAAAQVAGEAGRRAAVIVHHHDSSTRRAPAPCHGRSTRCSATDGGLGGAHGGGLSGPRHAAQAAVRQFKTPPNPTSPHTSKQAHKHTHTATQVSTPHTLRVPSPPWCVAHEMKLRCAAAAPHLHMCDGGWRPSAAAARAPSGGPRHTHRDTHSILLMTAAVCCVCIVTMTAAEAAVRRVGARSLTALRAQASTTAAAGSNTPHTLPTQP